MTEANVYLCPCCDKAIAPGTTVCPQCNQPVTVSSSSLAADPSNQETAGYAAMCFLKMRLYDKAMPLFEKAIDNNYDSAEPYFMAAICLLRGKKPFLAQRADIDKAVEYLNAADMIEPKAIHHYLLAYIKEDYFDRKYLNISPTAQEEHGQAAALGLTPEDEATLHALLNV